MQRAARGMSRIGLRFDLILTSPLARAIETAGIVAGTIEPAPSPRVVAALQAGCRLSTVAPVVARLAEEAGPAAGVLLVGHHPDLGRIAADLIGSRPPIAFGRGTLCAVDVPDWTSLADSPPATLGFLLPAPVLEALG